MKNLFALFLFFTAIVVFGQENDKTQNTKWTIGFGMNFIDNTSSYNNQYFNSSKQWNSIATISKVSIERTLNDLFSAEVAFTVNKLTHDKLQNGTTIVSDINYIGLDLGGKFYFDEFIVKKSKIDAYVILGAGLNSANSIYNGTGNYGLGFNYWLEPNLGIRLQTIGKYAFDQKPVCNNHIQHSVELIFKF
jgi:hypothetical protein